MSEINTNEIELLVIEFRNRQEIKETPRAKIFRDKLKEIENILGVDYSIKKFVEELNKYGYEITLGAFKYDLHRARQHLKSKNNDSSIGKLPSNNNQSSPQKADSIPTDNEKKATNQENEKPKYGKRQSIKQIQAEAALEFKELEKNAKKQLPKAVQHQLDKLEKLKNEQENSGN